MISFIIGKLEFISDKYIVVANNGIGYKIFIPLKMINDLKLGSDIKVHTYMNVREDAILLYGFLSLEQLNVFDIMLSVSGIGPKLALSIIDTLTPDNIIAAILNEDFDTLCSCSGVGKKTAQRIVIELRDKFKNYVPSKSTCSDNDTLNDDRLNAIDALVSLGYSKQDSMKAVMEVCETDMPLEQIIRLALKKLNR